MAVIVPGSIVGDIRGSVGEETYSRNQGGLYVKSRAGPAAAPTAEQLIITAAMTALSRAWSTTLTDEQRESWRTYAHQFPKNNRWGTPTLHNGYTRFIGVNFLEYVRVSAVLRTLAPTAPPLPLPAFAFTCAHESEEIVIDFPLSPAIPNDSTFRLYIYFGSPMPLGVNFYVAPFTFLASQLKTNGVWDADPWTIGIPFEAASNQKLFARARIQDTITGAISGGIIAWTIPTD